MMLDLGHWGGHYRVTITLMTEVGESFTIYETSVSKLITQDKSRIKLSRVDVQRKWGLPCVIWQ